MTSWLPNTAEAWWGWMTAMSLQITVLVAVVALADRILRRWVWPQLLMALWLVVLLKLVLPPTLTSPWGIARLVPSDVGLEGLPTNAQLSVETSPAAIPVIAFAVWLTVVVLLIILACWRYLRARRQWLGDTTRSAPGWLNAIAQEAGRRLGVQRTVSVRLRQGDVAAALVGFIRPVIVLPARLVRETTREPVQHVLLHELAHVKRRDAWWNLAFLVVQLLYWFHPLVWLARRRWAVLREICCDQMAVGASADPSTAYRETLLRLARPLVERSAAAPLEFLGRRSQLLARLEWLDRDRVSTSWRHRLGTAFVGGILLICCVPMARGESSVDPTMARGIPVRESPRPQSPPQATAVSLPPWDDLRGCLQRRYLILGMLAQQESTRQATLE